VVTVGNAVLALPVVATVKWAIAERQERPGAAVSGARAR